jgi:hypothetical protein
MNLFKHLIVIPSLFITSLLVTSLVTTPFFTDAHSSEDNSINAALQPIHVLGKGIERKSTPGNVIQLACVGDPSNTNPALACLKLQFVHIFGTQGEFIGPIFTIQDPENVQEELKAAIRNMIPNSVIYTKEDRQKRFNRVMGAAFGTMALGSLPAVFAMPSNSEKKNGVTLNDLSTKRKAMIFTTVGFEAVALGVYLGIGFSMNKIKEKTWINSGSTLNDLFSRSKESWQFRPIRKSDALFDRILKTLNEKTDVYYQR